MHVAMMFASLALFNADFGISTDTLSQYYPQVMYQNNQYYVFWSDYRYYSPDYCLFGARVSATGTVIDRNGKLLFRRQAAYEPVVAYDGTNFLVAVRDSC